MAGRPSGRARVSARALDRVLHGPDADRGIEVAYQPIVDLDRGIVAGYEALSRFPGPAPSPLPWFELARSLGHNDELEAAALEAALSAVPRLPVNTFLAVNLGPDVLTSPLVRDVWRSAPTLAGVVVELTETVRVESFDALRPSLDELRSHGALLAIDDAGAGYAGLNHLLALRPDIVKLDRSIVSGLDRDEAKRALVEMMGTFAGHLDAWLLAEGVETAAELDTLTRLGVPLAQGFHLGRPSRDFDLLDAEVAMRLVARPRTPDPLSLRSLLEDVPAATTPQGARTAMRRRGTEIAVLVDDDHRPLATVDVAGTRRGVRESGLRITVDTPVEQAAERAVVRPVESRFLPLVCVDDAGRFLGVVRMERLVERLARTERPD